MFSNRRILCRESWLKHSLDRIKIMIRNADNPRIKGIGVKLVTKVVENIAMWTLPHRGRAWIQSWKLVTVLKSKISLSLKLHMFHSLLQSMICYNTETRATTKVIKKERYYFGISCYWQMLGIRRNDRVRKEVLQRVKSNFKNFLYKHQLIFLGPWICTDDIITFFAFYINN